MIISKKIESVLFENSIQAPKTISVSRILFAVTFLWLMAAVSSPVKAEHIIGGVITYECLGYTNNNPASNSRRYRIIMKVYRDCRGSGAGFDSTPGAFPAHTTIYRSDRPTVPVRVFSFARPTETDIDPNPGNLCVVVPPNVCVQEGVYVEEIDLPILPVSYFISYQRCCRNATISNIQDPARTGATYSVEITPEAQLTCNNSPVFDNFPPIVLCANEPFAFSHSAIDRDGDSLVYAFCAPFLGGGPDDNTPRSPNGTAPDPDQAPPYQTISFLAPNFTEQAPLGITSDLTIDPATGLIQGVPRVIGQFVMGVCVREYRAGQLISTIRRDFQLNVSSCDPVVEASLGLDSLNANGEYIVQSCGGTVVSLINESRDTQYIEGYRWEFSIAGNQQTVLNTRDVTVDFGAPGTYTGRLILNPLGDCRDTADLSITILPEIQAAFTLVGDTCQTGPLQLQYQQAVGLATPSTWQWQFGDGGTSTNRDPLHSYTQPGDFTIRLQVESAEGCVDTTSRSFRYYPVPPDLEIRADIGQGCQGQQVSFASNSPVSPTGYLRQWDFGDGQTATGSSPRHIYEQAGTFPVSLRIQAPNGCVALAQLAQPIAIAEAPTANFTFDPERPSAVNPTVQFTDASTNAFTWQWDFGGLGAATEQDPVFTFPDTGRYVVTLLAGHPSGCVDTARQVINVVSLVAVYFPNAFSPNDDGVNDVFRGEGSFGTIQRDFQFQIWSRWGDLIFQTNDPNGAWDGRVNNYGELCPEGVYLYTVTYRNEMGKLNRFVGTVALLR
ncbi:MAG: PKD domain-containing protein [Lewinellaceae bacterium]|nr:PKD domain-containing protein [Lewinellaceae bacterium]